MGVVHATDSCSNRRVTCSLRAPGHAIRSSVALIVRTQNIDNCAVMNQRSELQMDQLNKLLGHKLGEVV